MLKLKVKTKVEFRFFVSVAWQLIALFDQPDKANPSFPTLLLYYTLGVQFARFRTYALLVLREDQVK